MNRFVITTSRGDNCILVGSEICVVKNIIRCESGVYFVYTIFKQSESLFDYPLDLRQLAIYKCPEAAKRVYAVESSEATESEPVDNKQQDESDEDGFTRVTRKRPARAKPKAVIGHKTVCR